MAGAISAAKFYVFTRKNIAWAHLDHHSVYMETMNFFQNLSMQVVMESIIDKIYRKSVLQNWITLLKLKKLSNTPI
jgi:leucyl aminopeptidase